MTSAGENFPVRTAVPVAFKVVSESVRAGTVHEMLEPSIFTSVIAQSSPPIETEILSASFPKPNPEICKVDPPNGLPEAFEIPRK